LDTNLTQRDKSDTMTFWDHLDILRMSLFRILGAVLIVFIGCFIAMPHIFDKFILGPATSDFFLYKWLAAIGNMPFGPDLSDSGFHVDIINIHVASQFMTHISTAFWMAIILSFPYIIYEIWKFIRPALLPEEKQNVRFAFIFGTLIVAALVLLSVLVLNRSRAAIMEKVQDHLFDKASDTAVSAFSFICATNTLSTIL